MSRERKEKKFEWRTMASVTSTPSPTTCDISICTRTKKFRRQRSSICPARKAGTYPSRQAVVLILSLPLLNLNDLNRHTPNICLLVVRERRDVAMLRLAIALRDRVKLDDLARKGVGMSFPVANNRDNSARLRLTISKVSTVVVCSEKKEASAFSRDPFLSFAQRTEPAPSSISTSTMSIETFPNAESSISENVETSPYRTASPSTSS